MYVRINWHNWDQLSSYKIQSASIKGACVENTSTLKYKLRISVLIAHIWNFKCN